MARPVWSGSLGFGLVNVPVKLYAATEDKNVRFHQLDANSGERVRHQRVTESGDQVADEDLQRGYEISPGNYVLVTDEELDSVEPSRSASIEIEDFVRVEDIDPVYFQRSYYIMPGDQEAATTSYRLLRAAIDEEQRVGIGRFVMRGRQHLAAIRTSDSHLVLETMYFSDEVRDPAQLGDADVDADGEPPQRELDMARNLVDSLAATWDPERYGDTYREQLLGLIRRKADGEEIVTEQAAEPEETNVVDLMSMLEASIDEARQGRRRSGSGSSRRSGRGGGTSGGSSDGDGWERLSKDELYDEAQRHDISGRSRMSKSELIEALQTAS